MKSPTTAENPEDILEQLESLSVGNLRQIRAKADSLISSKESAEKERALNEIKQLIEEKGLSSEEVRQSIFPPKYVHPNDPSKSWSGKGKKAVWLQDEIDAGRKLEDFVNPSWKESNGN